MGFPSSPADEQVYTNANGTRYQYDSTDNKWVVIGGAYNLNTLTVNTLNINEQLNNIYYCSTNTEINDAITTIGSGAGTIILDPSTIAITSNIVINNATANINIKGHQNKTVLDMSDGIKILVTSVDKLILEDFKIDAADHNATTDIMFDVDDGLVICRNITFLGGTQVSQVDINGTVHLFDCFFDTMAIVDINGDNCIIKDCDFDSIGYDDNSADGAIRFSGDRMRVINNYIHTISLECDTININAYILIQTTNSIFSNNIIYDINRDTDDCKIVIIYVNGDKNIFSNNLIYGCHNNRGATATQSDLYVFQVLSDDCVFSGNIIHDCGSDEEDCYVFYVNSTALNCTFIGNVVTNIDADEMYGIYSAGTYCSYIGNVFDTTPRLQSTAKTFLDAGSGENTVIGNQWGGDGSTYDASDIEVSSNNA